MTESYSAVLAGSCSWSGQLFSPSAPQSSSPAVKNKASLGSWRGQAEIGEQVTIVSEFKQSRSQAWSLQKGSGTGLFKVTVCRLLLPLYAIPSAVLHELQTAVCVKQVSVDSLWKWNRIWGNGSQSPNNFAALEGNPSRKFAVCPKGCLSTRKSGCWKQFIQNNVKQKVVWPCPAAVCSVCMCVCAVTSCFSSEPMCLQSPFQST